MQLLTVQMENQDPTTPMDSNEEMQQIVQISSMQNMSTMSADLTQMTASQTWSLANSYLGRQVTLNDTNGNPVAGQITAINTSSSTPTVQVNGTYYPLTSLTSIQLATTSASGVSTSATTTPSTTTPATTTPATTTPAAATSTASTVTPTSIASSIVNAILPSN
jgi:flagellar basal-body rod modification protein FlgD